MTVRRTAAVAASAAVLGIVLAGCSGGSSNDTSQQTTKPSAKVENLLISDYVRAQLLLAEAKATKLPKTAFAGFVRENEHFSFDSDDNMFWGGAQMVAAKTSLPARTALTGAGSYLIFSQVQGKTAWTVYNTGAGGCPVTIPAEVLTAWGWKAGTCRPS